MSRSSTQKFLVGQFRDFIPDNQLPTEKDVLKFLFHKKHAEYLKSEKHPQQDKLISCPIDHNFSSKCSVNDECTEENSCVVRELKKSWARAGFPVIEDRSIRDKVKKIDDEWSKINKNKSNKSSKRANIEQDEYRKKINNLIQ